MDEEKVRLLVQVAARDAAEAAVAKVCEGMPRLMADALDDHYARMGLSAEHLVWLKNRFEAERSTWAIGRQVIVRLALVAVLLFVGNAAWQMAMEKFITASEARRGVDQRPATP